MMQEEELVIKDENPAKFTENSENSHLNSGQDVLPFAISDGDVDGIAKEYKITLYEVFVTVIIMLSTISGGYLEGYSSPALPSLLKHSNETKFVSASIGSLLNGADTERQFPSNLSSGSDNYNSSNANLIANKILNFTENDTNILNKEKDEGNVTVSEDEINLDLRNNTNDLENENIINSTESSNAVTEFTTLFENNLNSSIITESENESAILNLSTTLFPEVIPSPLPLVDNLMKENDEKSSKLQITEEEGSWLGSLLLLGAAFGSCVSPWLIRWGRRYSIILSALPRLLGWILITISNSLSTFYFGRFICGISVGAVSPAAPIYMSEVSHPSYRGSLSCVVYLGVNVGIFIASLFGTGFEWQGLAVIGCITVLSYFLPSFFIPNSPTWLVLNGKENDARTSLKKLRGKNHPVEEELQQIISINEKTSLNKEISWKGLFTQRRTVLPLSVVLLLTIINRFSGYNAIVSYCSLFIHEAVPSVSVYWATVAVFVVQIGASVGSMFLVDSWGRRKLLIFSLVMMGLSLLSIVVYESSEFVRNGGAWIAILSTMSYVGAYSLGIGPLTWVLMGELFPMDAREKASAVAAVTNWLLAFLVTKTYFSLESSVGIGGTCLIYSSVCLFGTVSVFFLVPETKGRSLAEIEAHLSYTQKVWFPTIRKFDQALSNILDQDAAVIDTYSTFQ